MDEPQCLCVQCLARTGLEAVFHELAVFAEMGALEYFVAAIAVVVEERVPYVFHVYPDLVRASCLEVTLHK